MRDAEALDVWIDEASESGIPAFKTIARSIMHDYDAVQAALLTPWSTGQCEDQICRVKLIKRQGYGRAKLDLLRQRILHRAAAS
jgi:transposase